MFGFGLNLLNMLGRPCKRKMKPRIIQIKSFSEKTVEESQSKKSPKVQKQNSVSIEDENADKGYFGIVTFFVQMSAAMTIHIEFSEIDNTKSFQATITENMGKFLGIRFSELSIDACPLKGLTTAGKNGFKFVFLLGIYVSWFVLLICGDIIMHFLENRKISTESKNIKKSFKITMVQGLVEIVKYTYSGFCEIIFMSLVCVKLGSDYVWWYDATNVCLEN